MIQAIIDDAKAMEAEAIKDELDGQQSYEDFVTKTQLKAKEEQDKVMEEGNSEVASEDLAALKQEELDLHENCDYIIKNFEVRLTARDEEVGALKEGLATFGGAKFSAFMQAW